MSEFRLKNSCKQSLCLISLYIYIITRLSYPALLYGTFRGVSLKIDFSIEFLITPHPSLVTIHREEIVPGTDNTNNSLS